MLGFGSSFGGGGISFGGTVGPTGATMAGPVEQGEAQASQLEWWNRARILSNRLTLAVPQPQALDELPWNRLRWRLQWGLQAGAHGAGAQAGAQATGAGAQGAGAQATGFGAQAGAQLGAGAQHDDLWQ